MSNNADESISNIRHDLRSHLFSVREGVSQVLDGLGGEDCAKCFEILKTALEEADKLNKLIGDLLTADALKSILQKRDYNTLNLSESEKDNFEKIKNVLLNKISHEIRTPLTVTKEGLSLVLDEVVGKLNSEQKEYLTDVKNSTDRLVRSIEDILETPWDKIKDLADHNISERVRDKER